MGFCDSSQSTSAQPVWADPLGPSSLGKKGRAVYGTTGAPQMRDQIFNALRGYAPAFNTAASNLSSTIPSEVNNPFYGRARTLASETLAGNYLNGSPALDRAAAATTSQAMKQAADSEARIRSGFAQSGGQFSTGYQQAAQANRAAANADAARTNAQLYAQNYLSERQNQNAAPAMFEAAQAAPFNYLSQAAGSVMSPVAQQGSILSALSSGGQIMNPRTVQTLNPSLGSNIVNGWAGVIGNL